MLTSLPYSMYGHVAQLAKKEVAGVAAAGETAGLYCDNQVMGYILATPKNS